MANEKTPLLHRPQSRPPASATLVFIRRSPRLSLFLFAAIFLLIAVNIISYVEMRSPRTLPASYPRYDVTLGIALTPTYGTVAVRDWCDKLEKVIKVPGNERYISMMKRLSDPQSRHPSEPYGSVGEIIADWPRQALRRARKVVGQPASADVGTIAAMITDLRQSLKTQGDDVDAAGAVLAFPAITALYEEDARDALKYLDIKNLIGSYILEHVPYAMDAAFGGYGYGLCENWRDQKQCREEFKSLPGYKTLLIDYSNSSITIDIAFKRAVTGDYVPPSADTDFDLGSDKKTPDDAEAYWQSIKDRVSSWIEKSTWNSVDLVLLTGESANDHDLVNVVNEVVGEWNPEIRLADEPEFVAAIGLSVLSRRSLGRW